MTAPFRDAAVGDDVLVPGDALQLVQFPQRGCVLESTVLLHRLGPGDVRGTRDVSAPQRSLVGVIRHVETFTGELFPAAYVDQSAFAGLHPDDVLQYVGRESTDRGIAVRHGVITFFDLLKLRGQRAALSDPFLTATVHQTHVLMPVVLEEPEGVSRPPVRLVAVQHDRVRVADALVRHQFREGRFVDEVPDVLPLQFRMPVEFHGTLDMAGVVKQDVFVHLYQPDSRCAQVVLYPIGAYEHFRLCVFSHVISLCDKASSHVRICGHRSAFPSYDKVTID